MIPAMTAPPPISAPPAVAAFVWRIQDWLNLQGVPTARTNVYAASRDQLTDSAGTFHGALSQPADNAQWYSPEAMALMTGGHNWPPPEYAVRIAIHESLHQHNPTDEGLVESVSQDLTRKWYQQHAPAYVPYYADMGKYENITATRKATTVGGQWWNQASRLKRRVMLVGPQVRARVTPRPKVKRRS